MADRQGPCGDRNRVVSGSDIGVADLKQPFQRVSWSEERPDGRGQLVRGMQTPISQPHRLGDSILTNNL